MNNRYYRTKSWLIKNMIIWFWLHAITLGITAWLMYKKWKNSSFELTESAIKYRNGGLTRTINYRTIEGFVRNGNTIGITAIGEQITGGSLVINDIERIDEFEARLEKYLEAAK